MQIISTVFAAAVMMGAGAVAFAEQSSPADAATFIARFVDGQTVVAGRVDLARVDVDKLLNRFQERTGLNLAPFQPEREAAKAIVAELRGANVKELYVIARIGETPRLIAPVENAELAARLEKIVAAIGGEAKQAPGALILSRRGTPAIAPGQAVAGAEIQKAFVAAEGAEVQLAFVLSADARRVIADFLPTYAGQSTVAVTRDFQWGGAGIDLQPNFRARLVAQCDDARGAEDLKSLLDALVAEAQQFVVKVGAAGKDFSLSVRSRVEGSSLKVDTDEIQLKEEETNAIVKAMVGGVWVPAARRELSNRIKQIGLAVHNYHDVNNTLPPQGLSKDGKTMLLSWRVLVLPWLGETALYKEFHLDEPWDSEHNKKLIPRMPELYKIPRAMLAVMRDANPKPGETWFQAPGAEGTVFYGPMSIRLRDIKDGLAYTAMMVVSPRAKPVVWTKPDDLGIDLNDPYAVLGGDMSAPLYVLNGDGSTMTKQGLSAKELRALLDISAGRAE